MASAANAISASLTRGVPAMTSFDALVSGLAVDVAVQPLGIQVGTVKDIQMWFDFGYRSALSVGQDIELVRVSRDRGVPEGELPAHAPSGG